MASVGELAAHVRRALALIASAREILVHSHDLMGDVAGIWGAVLAGATDPDAAQLPALGESVRTGIADHVAAAQHAEQALAAYLNRLGADAPEGEPKGAPSPASTPAPESTPTSRAERIERARQRVGESRVPGSQARGEWVRSDGWSVRITSGKGDEHHGKVTAFVRDNNLPRQAVRLATHVEVKIALVMREQRLRDETVVIDRPVCGTLETDRDDPFTCDKYLPRFLPSGACLRVVQPDGTVSEYTGTETEQQ